MKKTIFLIFLIILQYIDTFGQLKKDSISIDNKKRDIKCYQKGSLLTNFDYSVIFKNNPKALKEIKSARSHYKTGRVFEYIGGFVIGFCLASAISGEKIDYTWWWTMGSSAAVAGTGLIIYNSGKKHHINAVKEYNSTLTLYFEPKLNSRLRNNNLCLKFNF